MIDLGMVRPGSTVRIPWGSYDGTTGASEAASSYADADILVYKDGSTTETAGGSCGGTTTTSFDSASLTGINLITLNLADNTTAGWWAAGSEYLVMVGPVTVDTQTIYFPAARFVIGSRDALLNTTIATLSTQTSFTLTTGPAEDDALNGCVVYLHDVASAVQCGFAVIQDYTGASKTVTLVAGTTFTAAATDNVCIMAPRLVPTVLGRTLDIAAGGEAEANVTQWLGSAAATPTVAGVPEVDVTHWIGTAAATPTVAGVPEVDLTHWLGTGAATPTIAGVPEVDVTHWFGSPVPIPTVTGVPEVDITHIGGDAQSATDLKDFADAGYDPATNKVQGVVLTDTLTTYTGNTVQTGDSFARLGSPILTTISADIQAIDNFIDNEITDIIALIDNEVSLIKAKTDSLTFTKALELDANIQSINGTTVLGDGGATPWGP